MEPCLSEAIRLVCLSLRDYSVINSQETRAIFYDDDGAFLRIRNNETRRDRVCLCIDVVTANTYRICPCVCVPLIGIDLRNR